jgi:hypothetical protein
MLWCQADPPLTPTFAGSSTVNYVASTNYLEQLKSVILLAFGIMITFSSFMTFQCLLTTIYGQFGMISLFSIYFSLAVGSICGTTFANNMGVR